MKKMRAFVFAFPLLLQGISVFQNSYIHNRLGYNNCNMKNNGESLVVSNFIKEGMLVFDVGANVGEWSNNVRRKKPAVIYAFEPIPETYSKLEQNFASNESVVTLNFGVSSENGEREICYYNTSVSRARLSSFYHRKCIERRSKTLPEQIVVKTISLDSFCFKNSIDVIDFLKIDTEGAEFDVLKGAVGLLENQQIEVIQFEYGGTYPDAGITLEEVYSFLKNYGYEIYRIIPDGLIHIPAWDKNLENFKYSNYLAILTSSIQKFNLDPQP